MSLIFSCRETARLLSAAQDSPLSRGQRILLGMHTLMCSACRAYQRQIGFLDQVFIQHARRIEPAVPVSEELDAAARERIRARLRQP